MSDDIELRYTQLMKRYLGHIFQRPRMYFRRPDDLEVLFDGYSAAFKDVLDVRLNTFNQVFSDWLYDKYHWSCASGWAYIIRHVAEEQGKDPQELMLEKLKEFIAEGKPLCKRLDS